MKATPRTLKMKPMELAVPNLTAFFKISKKAFQAAAQKFFPVRAIYKKKLKSENQKEETYLDVGVL